jgi:hypothetical protein
VLSHHPLQHLDDLFFTHRPLFDQTRHHPHIPDHGGVESHSTPLQLPTTELPILIRSGFPMPSLAVLNPFLCLAFFCGVVLDTALGRSPLAVRVATPKRTSQIPASGVSGMRQEENPAMPAAGHTPP